MKKQIRNQHTGAASLTERNADTIRGCIRKLEKIRDRTNLYVRQARTLDDAILAMREALKMADRAAPPRTRPKYWEKR